MNSTSIINKTFFQLRCSVVSNCLWPHGLQHTRPPCPSSSPGVYSNPCALSQWCHPTISSSVVPFSSHLQSFPASGSFPRSQFFTSGGQRIGVSASASVLPVNIQDSFPFGMDWLDLLAVQGPLKSLLQYHRCLPVKNRLSYQYNEPWTPAPRQCCRKCFHKDEQF